jgi:type II secretory pathway pseudopilin PulG
MGIQQILLLVLVTILVGIATIVAINNFQESYDASNFDAVRQDISQAHNMSQSYYHKPKILGGGGGSYEGITLQLIHLPEQNENASYFLDEITDTEFTIIAESVAGFVVRAVISGEQIRWEREEG